MSQGKAKTTKADMMVGALSATMQTERQRIDSRFEAVENLSDIRETAETKRSKKAKPKTQTTPRPKTTRVSFTFTEGDVEIVQKLREKCWEGKFEANQSELVRAGIHILSQGSVHELKKAVAAIERLRPGRERSQ